MNREYRVRWRREGLGWRRELRQTLAGAQRLARRQATANAEMTWTTEVFGGREVPPIVDGPYIEEREVGEWALLPAEPSE